MVESVCERCEPLRLERDALLLQVAELSDLVELQKADLERYKKATEAFAPNHPERVPPNQLQLGFERILSATEDSEDQDQLRDAAGPSEDKDKDKRPRKSSKETKKKRGRRRLDLTNLPVEEILIDPDEVVSADGEGFERIGEEVSERVAFRPGTYMRLRIVRTKWARKKKKQAKDLARVITAELPESVWPDFMADPSVIAQTIVAKYADSLPLHRQEQISARHGFAIPRSTQCGWLSAAYGFLHRIVNAMFSEALQKSYCIATDATGAPVRGPGRGKCEPWQVFVFIADEDHVLFRYAQSGTSAAISDMLDGFRGYVLADASKIFDVLFREMGMTEVACWFHQRRRFYKAIGSDPERAYEALALISKLFKINRECARLPESQRTAERAKRASVVLGALDTWIDEHREEADPRGPLDQAIGYYDNQREALHRFLEDWRLRMDNNGSERALRNLALGRSNWCFFENETGVKWYTVFRSLIASCALHGLNPQHYLEALLRLAPHWPVCRVLELAPKYWTQTLDRLGPRQRDMILPPWQRAWPKVEVRQRAA